MMRRKEILAYVEKQYGIKPDYPWEGNDYAVLRHSHNRKWFAVLVKVTESQLGLRGEKLVDAINLKCDPLLISTLRGETGIYPAWHMNKEHWLTVMLTSPIPKGRVCYLLDMSYELTRGRTRKR